MEKLSADTAAQVAATLVQAEMVLRTGQISDLSKRRGPLYDPVDVIQTAYTHYLAFVRGDAAE